MSFERVLVLLLTSGLSLAAVGVIAMLAYVTVRFRADLNPSFGTVVIMVGGVLLVIGAMFNLWKVALSHLSVLR